MEKYLGNKRILLSDIGNFVDAHCGEVSSVVDAFAGTTNVGRFFRRRGCDIISNDINRFSFALGATYLRFHSYPKFQRLSSLPVGDPSTKEALKRAFINASCRDNGLLFPTARATRIWDAFARSRAIDVLAYLNELIPGDEQFSTHIVDHFTQFGEKSRYTSLRGTTGKRNYFSRDNAIKLDGILHTLRDWWQQHKLTWNELHYLVCSLIEEVVLTANVTGTFHDFNRERLWPNATQAFFLKPPLTFVARSSSRLYCTDAVRLAPKLPFHDLLYIDPPYNFRQYTAYYHFLNFVAAYPVLPSLDRYLEGLSFVRGQNMRDDFTSDFCFRDRFIDALKKLIAGSKSRYVVMSYYGGRNHWNHWSQKDEGDDYGFDVLSSVFDDRCLFRRSTAVDAIQLRQNFQSRNGEHKEMVNEHLFFGERRQAKTDHARPRSIAASPRPQETIELTNFLGSASSPAGT